MVPWAYSSPQPKRHLNQFRRFYTADGREWSGIPGHVLSPKNCPFAWSHLNSQLIHGSVGPTDRSVLVIISTTKSKNFETITNSPKFFAADFSDNIYWGLTATTNSTGNETANVNFFTTTPLTTFTHCTPKATEFGEITQNKGNYAVYGDSRSPILVPIESSYTTSY